MASSPEPSLVAVSAAGSADRQPQQKSSFTGGAARPSLEKWLCSSYPQTGVVATPARASALQISVLLGSSRSFTHRHRHRLRCAARTFPYSEGLMLILISMVGLLSADVY